MFNRKLLGICLPVIVASAVVGSGLSAWYFEESSNSMDVTGSVSVAPLIEGTLASDLQTGGFKILLDQGKLEQKTNVNYGIKLKKSDDSDLSEITATYTLDSAAVTSYKSNDCDFYLYLKCEVEFKEEIFKYVDPVNTADVAKVDPTVSGTIAVTDAEDDNNRIWSYEIGLGKNISLNSKKQTTDDSNNQFKVTFGIKTGAVTNTATDGQQDNGHTCQFLNYSNPTGQDDTTDFSNATGKPIKKGAYEHMKGQFESPNDDNANQAIKVKFSVAAKSTAPSSGAAVIGQINS